ncbi:cytochrome b [Paremcibacter congregatus]|uniref:cytochrome b n=1 Tax=Paremcibacter congregatus TaxID=2043170 RepID=UPI0030EEEE8F|tara:strand:+ start:4198 stop:5466 length:1269 start_codon:yes stop_codon:yes gene_type:complete
MGSSTYTPENKAVKWFEDRLPILGLIHGTLGAGYNAPRNLNYWWNFGSLAGFMLVVQIITGIILVMHYTPHVDFAFAAVEHIMRDVNYGWLIRYIHANGASMFFVVVYIHILRGMYFGSYQSPREVLWFLGLVIYLLMMATGFMGYVLPWGQMSFWGATVITNLFGAFDFVDGMGESILHLLWGGFSVDNPTLQRFFSLHYLLPFVIVGVVILHIWALHLPGSNNPLGIDAKGPGDKIPFHPYYTAKDAFGLSFFIVIFAVFIFFMPNIMGHPDNYIEANPMVTPAHIVPEWYYLPFYTILKAVPDKLLGVIAMFASILIFFVLPWLDGSKIRSAKFRPVTAFFFWVFLVNAIFLGYLGTKLPDEVMIDMAGGVTALTLGQIGSVFYFAYFIVIVPLVSRMESTKPVPTSIAQSVLDANQKG